MEICAEGLKIGLQPNLFLYSPIEEAIKQTLELKPDCIEIVYEIPQFPPNTRGKLEICGKLKELLSTYNVETSVHSCFFEMNLGSEYSEVRKLTLDQVEKCIKFSHNISGENVTVHSGYFPLVEDYKDFRITARERFEEDIRTCVRIASEYGIKLSVENMDSLKFFIHNLEEAAKLSEKIDGLGVTFDIAHLNILKSKLGIHHPEKQIAEEIVSFMKDCLTHVHLSDNFRTEDSHLPPGNGKIDFEPIVRAIKKINFEGQVIIELWKPPHPAEAGIKALKVVREFF